MNEPTPLHRDTPRPPAPVENQRLALRVLAFLVVGVPLLIPVIIIAWKVALSW